VAINLKQLKRKNFIIKELIKNNAMENFDIIEEDLEDSSKVYRIVHKFHDFNIDLFPEDLEIYYRGEWIQNPNPEDEKELLEAILSDYELILTERDYVEKLKKVLRAFHSICTSTMGKRVCGFQIEEDDDVTFRAYLNDIIDVMVEYEYGSGQVFVELIPNEYLQSFYTHLQYFTIVSLQIPITDLNKIRKIIENRKEVVREKQAERKKFIVVNECYDYLGYFIEGGYYWLDYSPAWVVPKECIFNYGNITEEEFDEIVKKDIEKIEKDLQEKSDREFYNWYYNKSKSEMKKIIEDIKNDMKLVSIE